MYDSYQLLVKKWAIPESLLRPLYPRVGFGPGNFEATSKYLSLPLNHLNAFKLLND